MSDSDSSSVDWGDLLAPSAGAKTPEKPVEKIKPQGDGKAEVKPVVVEKSAPPPAPSAPAAAPVPPVKNDGFDFLGEPSPPSGTSSPEAASSTPSVATATKQVHAATLPAVGIGEFTFTEAQSGPQSVIVIYGDKADGKTAAALSLPGTIAALSFDNKTLAVKKNLYQNTERIHVYNAAEKLTEESPSQLLESNDHTFRYTLFLLEKIRETKFDWIVIDGLDIVQQICEMTMRARNNIQPFAGFPNRNLWKERNMYLRQIHRLALEGAKRGVVYTTYISQVETMKDGQTVDKIDKPKWADVVFRESDIVIRVKATPDKNGIKFFATVESSKLPLFITGTRAEISDVGLRALNNKL